jgi:hypothetical protein
MCGQYVLSELFSILLSCHKQLYSDRCKISIKLISLMTRSLYAGIILSIILGEQSISAFENDAGIIGKISTYY